VKRIEDDSATIGDILAEMGNHEEFHNVSFTEENSSFEVPLQRNTQESLR